MNKKLVYDNSDFEKRVNEVFQEKWNKAMKEGTLITCTLADQMKREAIKQVKKDYPTEHKFRFF